MCTYCSLCRHISLIGRCKQQNPVKTAKPCQERSANFHDLSTCTRHADINKGNLLSKLFKSAHHQITNVRGKKHKRLVPINPVMLMKCKLQVTLLPLQLSLFFLQVSRVPYSPDVYCRVGGISSNLATDQECVSKWISLEGTHRGT